MKCYRLQFDLLLFISRVCVCVVVGRGHAATELAVTESQRTLDCKFYPNADQLFSY